MGLRASLDDVEKRKFLTLSGLELRPLGLKPVASHYTDCAIPAPRDGVAAYFKEASGYFTQGQ
jgi:hypothetical protein